MKKKLKELSQGQSTAEIIRENEKIIKFATIYAIAYSIIMVGLIIAFIYCKIKGI